MSKAIPYCPNTTCLNKKQLINLKTKAMRSGAWFKVLQRIDRVLFDLTIRVVSNIRSARLAKCILILTRKLENARKGSFSMHLREIGLPLAQKISSTAQKIGNLLLSLGSLILRLLSFWRLMNVNSSRIFKAKVQN